MHQFSSQLLMKLLSNLSKKELKEAEVFITTPLHNKNTSVCILFGTLKPFYPKFKIKPSDLENIYKGLYPDATDWMEDPKIASRFRSLSSKLSVCLKDFLAFKEYQKDKVAQKKYLLTALGKKELGKLFNQQLEQTEHKWTSTKHKEEESYLHLAQLKQQQFYHPTFLNEAKFKSLLPVIEQSSRYLSLYNVLYELKFRAEQLNSGAIYSKESDMRSIEKILLPVDTYPEIQDVFFQLYIQLNQLLQGNHNNDDDLFAAVIKNFEQVSTIEQQRVFKKLTNYCLRKINVKPTYKHRVFELYQYGIKYNLLSVNNQIEYLDFNNIVVIACMLSQFDWVHQFITSYSKQIRPIKIQNDITRLALAHLNMYQKNYAEVVEQLREHFNIFNLALNLLARSIHLRALYELWQQSDNINISNDYEIVRTTCYNNQKYINRKKDLSPSLKERYTNLVFFIQKLIILELKKQELGITPDKTEFFKELKSKNLAAKEWVEEKLNAI